MAHLWATGTFIAGLIVLPPRLPIFFSAASDVLYPHVRGEMLSAAVGRCLTHPTDDASPPLSTTP